MSLDTGCILEAPSQQTCIHHFPDIGLLMVGAGNVDAVTHDAVLKTDNGDLDMGPLIIHHQRGMRAGSHGDLTMRVPHRVKGGGRSTDIGGPGSRWGRTDDSVKR